MKLLLTGLAVVVLFACSDKPPVPDVSGIQVPLNTVRYDTAFFHLDTNHVSSGLQQLYQRYPGFTQDFLYNILGTSPDSAQKDAAHFISSYYSLYRDADKLFSNIKSTEAAVKRGLQFAHHYFPAYPLPKQLIYFIGPINSFGNIITRDGLAVGLQLYMGKDYPLYLTEAGQQLYPRFVSRRFEPAYIPVNCMKNIIDDMYPERSSGNTLAERMVESGKRQYLLSLLLPETPDTLRTGYTEQQLKGCYESEKNIWSFFVQNDLLFSTDPNMGRDYLNDGPNTPVFGDASPGNIGQFVGTQIVKKWMKNNRAVTPDQLMKTQAKKIFEEAKYKP
jgi:hypothetical protein